MPIMRSGVLVTYFSGVPTLADIAESLARMPRFAGHTEKPWSVLDHTIFCRVMVMPMFVPQLELALLLHDAHECITGDIPSDVKTESMKSFQRLLDNRIMEAHFPGGLAAYDALKDSVKAFDRRALAAEAAVLGVACADTAHRERVFGVALEEDVRLLTTLYDAPRTTPAQYGWVVDALQGMAERAAEAKAAALT